MGSRGSLLALSVVAAVLAAVWVLEPRPVAPPTARVLPGFVAAQAQRLVWRRAGQPDVIVTRHDGVWQVTAPVVAPADPATMDDVLATLELLSMERRGGAARARPIRFSLLVDDVRIDVGSSHAAERRAGGYVWVAVAGHGGQIDAYAARALDRDVDALRAHDPIEVDPDQVVGLELVAGDDMLVLSGSPLAVHLPGVPATVRASPAKVEAIVATLDQLTVTRFVTSAATYDVPRLVVRVVGVSPYQSLRVWRRCTHEDDGADGWLADTPVGRGCLPDEPVRRLIAYAGADVVDRHVITRPRADTIRIGRLSLARHGTVWRFADGTAADPDAVGAWLTEVAALDAVAVVIARPRGDLWKVTIDDTTLQIDRRRALVWRDAEGVALRLADVTAFTVDALAFRARAVIDEEPLALRRIRRGSTKLTRGETHDDWGRGADVVAVRAFRAAVARLRAERFTHASLGGGVLELEVEFERPAVGATARNYRLRIDRRCRARADGGPTFVIAKSTCAALRRRLTVPAGRARRATGGAARSIR